MIRVEHGDSRDVLKTLADESIDACVTDPPYSLVSIQKRFGKPGSAPAQEGRDGLYRRASAGFMGKQWDTGETAFDPAFWAEVLRVLKPGAFLLAMGGDRSYHRLATAIEDAGAEIRGCLAYLYGSGFPKSRNVTRDLLALPPCRCRVSEVGGDLGSVVETGTPAGLVGTGIGAEPGAVNLARRAADQTGGFFLEPSAEPLRRVASMQNGIEHAVGHGDPIVLGSARMAGAAERDEIAGDVSGVEGQPETLRDQMVSDKPAGRSAIDAPAISGDDLCREGGPSAPLVSPPLAAPRGVSVAGQPDFVVCAHAAAGTVGPGVAASDGVGPEAALAMAASENPHAADYSGRSSSMQCPDCGGVIQSKVPAGLGSALKPAMELIVFARKPLSENSIAANVLEHGCGALNVEGCRVGTFVNTTPPGTDRYNQANYEQGYRLSAYGRDGEASADRRYTERGSTNFAATPGPRGGAPEGRWPANIIHDGSDEVLEAFARFGEKPGAVSNGKRKGNGYGAGYGAQVQAPSFGDTGTAARFFYSAKASKKDRAGSKHPTVKPISLLRYLCRLITPPGGTVLDPFAGSGTTGEAARLEGFNAILIEREAEYIADINRRLAHVEGADTPLFAERLTPLEAAIDSARSYDVAIDACRAKLLAERE